jgi:hypothetical protein
MRSIDLTQPQGQAKQSYKTGDAYLDTPNPRASRLSKLMTFNIATDESIAERMKLCREAVFVLPQVALLGQSTVIFAAPNTGKTLLSIWMLLRTESSDCNVFYLNADDGFEGATEKAEILEGTGINMLTEGFDDFPAIVDGLVGEGEARDTVLVLDTVKKFTSVMNKTQAAEFTRIVRKFTQAGGTLIALAHTNKHVDGDGNRVMGGTSDLNDDFDCSYIAELDTPFDAPDRQVTLKAQKTRGPNKQKVSFSYDASSGKTWTQRLKSVTLVVDVHAEGVVKAHDARRSFEADKCVIDYLAGRMSGNGEVPGSSLARDDMSEGNPSRRERERVLERYNQSHEFPEYRCWTSQRMPKGGTSYRSSDNSFR